METQVRKLKINVTNIKSYLVTSNKKLKKLEYKKSNLIDSWKNSQFETCSIYTKQIKE